MRKKISLTLVFLMIFVMFGSYALANPQSIPNGPWIQPNQNVSLSSLLQPEDVEQRLLDIESRSKGRMETEIIGYSSGYEWPIYVAKFGDADSDNPKILIDTQIHGNEPLGTEAAMHLIQTLATSGNKEVRDILDNVTVWFIPMLNPDGATIFEIEDYGDAQTRQNIQYWTPEEWGLDADTPAPWYHNSNTWRGTPGYDINRDAHPHLNFDLANHSDQHSPCLINLGSQPGFYVTPEARALRDTFKELKPDLYINHHHRGSNIESEENPELTTLQILAQFVPLDRVDTIVDNGETYTYTLTEESLDLSRQVNALVYQKLQKGNSPFGQITKYPRVEEFYGGYGLPGTTLGSFSMNDAAVMLYETRGQSTRDTGQKANGQYIRQSLDGIYETILGFATGEVYEIDPSFYEDEIPEAGPRITNPTPGHDGF